MLTKVSPVIRGEEQLQMAQSGLKRTTSLQLPPKPQPTCKTQPPIIILKINHLQKTLPYQNHHHSFCAFPSPQKIKIPNKLNHFPHQLQGRQRENVALFYAQCPHCVHCNIIFISLGIESPRIIQTLPDKLFLYRPRRHAVCRAGGEHFRAVRLQHRRGGNAIRGDQ